MEIWCQSGQSPAWGTAPPPWTPGPAQSALRRHTWGGTQEPGQSNPALCPRVRPPTQGKVLAPAAWSPAPPPAPSWPGRGGHPTAQPPTLLTFRRSWRSQSRPSGRGARHRCCTGSNRPAKVIWRLRRDSETAALSTSASTSRGFQKRCSESDLHTDQTLSAVTGWPPQHPQQGRPGRLSRGHPWACEPIRDE